MPKYIELEVSDEFDPETMALADVLPHIRDWCYRDVGRDKVEDTLQAALAFVELHTGNGRSATVPFWAHESGGQISAEFIAAHAERTLGKLIERE